MSVAPLTARELGCFVAIAHKHLKAGPLQELCQIASLASSGNAGAYSAQYGEPMEVECAEAIETIALDYLADRRDMVADHFGPLAYNMVANDGKIYVAPGVEAEDVGQLEAIKVLGERERRAKEWQDSERRRAKRAKENAEAFNEIGQLPVFSKDEIIAKMQAANAHRIILAEWHVDMSDLQTDYHGGRTGRVVVIGFGKGKRENFQQLRVAAGRFPPTAHMGMGKDLYKPRVVFLNDIPNVNGRAYWKGSYSPWHRELCHDVVCSTLIEAAEHIMTKGDPHPVSVDGQLAQFGWRTDHDSYENRENWSMGGGNYLGTSRYGGWKVQSTARLYDNRYEMFA